MSEDDRTRTRAVAPSPTRGVSDAGAGRPLPVHALSGHLDVAAASLDYQQPLRSGGGALRGWRGGELGVRYGLDVEKWLLGA
jgi:hypothetical protein